MTFYLSWEKSTPNLPNDNFQPNVSIVIAVRNEAQNISNLLTDLNNQSYPKDKLDIIIVNDHSNDQTAELIAEFNNATGAKITLLNLEAEKGKKAAMHLGFKQASGEIIITTDGDCRLGSNWLRTLLTPLEHKEVNLVSGPVTLAPQRTFFERLQAIEFSSLIASGAATINLGFPTMTNAANMAIRSSVFQESKSKSGKSRSSGDDIFLLHDLAAHNPKSIAFCKDPETIVRTYPAPTLLNFLNQRKRWAGKWTSYNSIPTILLAVYIYLVNLSTLVLPVLAGLKYLDWILVVNLFLAKLLFEYLFLRHVQKFFNSRIHLLEFITLAIMYPVYVTLTGLIGSLTKYTWKNRRTR